MTRLVIKTDLPEELFDMAVKLEKMFGPKVIDKALGKAAKPIKEAIEQEVPDGVKTGTRDLQSETVRKRFPEHMKDNVRIRTRSDIGGALKIVGVTAKAGQVNFDFGDKAYSQGRQHIFWGHRPDPPVMRRQTDDLTARIEIEKKPEVLRILEEEVTRLINEATK